MIRILACIFFLVHLVSCVSIQPRQLSLAEELIDAFYSFDSGLLQSKLSAAGGSIPFIVYYQGWAEGGNYEIAERLSCVDVGPNAVNCSITVRDDPTLALGIDFKVTDTFHIALSDGKITSVKTSSNDLQVYLDAANWVRRELPELIMEPCKGFFAGGPTPAACARAMTTGYGKFAASEDFPKM